jgi:predicted PurR-regulated permease PerM
VTAPDEAAVPAPDEAAAPARDGATVSAAAPDGSPVGSGADAAGPRRAGLREVLARLRAERVALEDSSWMAPGRAGPTELRLSPTLADRAVEELEHERPRDQRSLLAPFRIGLLGGLGLLIAYAIYLSLDTIRGTLIVIAISALLAIGLDPAVALLIRRGIRRAGAVAIVYLGLLAFLFGAFYAIIPPIVTQIGAFISSLPDTLQNLQNNPTIKSLDAKFGIIKSLQSSDFVKNIGSGAAGSIFTVAGIAVDLVVVLILTLYFLAGLPRIKAAGYRLVPASKRARVTDIGDKIIKQMGGYLGGATLIALQAGLVAGVFSWIAGLPYPWAIALAAAVLDFVPVVGPIIIGISMVLLGFSQSLTIGIVAGAFYLCQHMFEAYWLYPRVMRRTVHISTAAVIVAILIGAALLGITGAVLAVPVAAAIQLIIREVVLPRQERS